MRAEKLIPEWNELTSKTIVIVGLGGTGTTTAQLIARHPLKNLILIDRDIVEESNLDRQVLYTKRDVNKPKVVQAQKNLMAESEIVSKFEDLNFKTIAQLIPKEADLIIDCTDNTETRLLINDYAKKHSIPWIYTAGVGQLGTVAFIHPDEACYNCFNKTKYGQTCAQAGVLNSTVSFIGSLAAHMATIYLTTGSRPEKLLYINLETLDLTKLGVPKDPNCKACNKVYEYLNGKAARSIEKLCGENRFAVNLFKPIDMKEVASRLNTNEEQVIQTGIFTIFPNGRILVKASSETEAKKLVDEQLGL